MDAPTDVDELGPIDWIVIEFPGSRFNGEIAPALADLVDRDLIHVLDLVILSSGFILRLLGGAYAAEVDDQGRHGDAVVAGHEADHPQPLGVDPARDACARRLHVTEV